VLLFLLFQVYLLANHYALAYKNLEMINLDLETKVQARQQRLTKANQVREKLLQSFHMISRSAEFVARCAGHLSKRRVSESEMKSLTGKIEENMNATSMLMDNILLWMSNPNQRGESQLFKISICRNW